jgi:hypothetical protein
MGLRRLTGPICADLVAPTRGIVGEAEAPCQGIVHRAGRNSVSFLVSTLTGSIIEANPVEFRFAMGPPNP